MIQCNTIQQRKINTIDMIQIIQYNTVQWDTMQKHHEPKTKLGSKHFEQPLVQSSGIGSQLDLATGLTGVKKRLNPDLPF